ncbi:MAG: hypothetical protein HFJ38_03690 [Bacilli bacterium]|nr:hypothetical protein [Bacilli bacterium]
MKSKHVVRFTLLVLFLLFVGLYITQALGYYEFTNAKKTTLTNSAIEKFEKDVKEGKALDVKNYVEEEKQYNNLLSRVSLSVSNAIEKSFSFVMNTLFNELAKATN